MLSDEAIERIRAYGHDETLEPGILVFERGVDFFVVVEGAVEIIERDEANRERINTSHGPSQFTGELDLFNDRQILVDGPIRGAENGGPARVIRVARPDFRRLITGEPDLGEIITRAFILRRTGFILHGKAGVTLLGAAGSSDALRLERFLRRNGYPVRSLDPEERPDAARDLMERRDLTEADLPAVIAPGATLRRPTIPELANALGLTEPIDPEHVHDVTVVGAGPAGLAAAVYAASEGLETLVVEGEAPGGQAGTSSKIENYLGFPTGISDQALAGRAWIQSQKFGARFALARRATALDCGTRPFRLTLEDGTDVQTRAVVLATGAAYRRLGLAGEDRFENQGLRYAATPLEAELCEGSEVAVVGGGNSAGQAAVFLARVAAHVHVLVRGDGLSATMSDYLTRRIEGASRITLHTRTEIVALHGERFLERVTWEGPEGRQTPQVGNVFVMIGAVPNTTWLEGCVDLDDTGFVRTGQKLTGGGTASSFETSQPGIFAVGDVRTGSIKRVASGVGEGSACVQAIHQYLESARRDVDADRE